MLAKNNNLGRDWSVEADLTHDVVMITVNKTLNHRNVYDSTRFSWKLNPERADRADPIWFPMGCD